MMKSFGSSVKIVVFLILVVQSQANNTSWYQTFLNEQVAPSYVSAYQTLKNKIINPLLAYKSSNSTTNGTNNTEILSLAQGVTCGAKELYASLSNALNASEQLNTIVENKKSKAMAAVLQKESEIQQVNEQLSKIEARMNDAQVNVNQAENEVKNKENELAQSDANLAEEEKKLDKARVCGLRKKRFLSKVWREVVRRPLEFTRDKVVSPVVRPVMPILKPVLRLPCAALNYGGINSAKERRGAAQGAVNAAREQLATRRQELERLRGERTNFQVQKSQATAQLQPLTLTLVQLQAQQVALGNMTQDMRNVIKHLASFVSKSSVLYDELVDLVSFELLIVPLNAILTELIDNGVTTKTIAGASQISSSDTGLTKNTLDLLKSQLSTLSSVENLSVTC